MLFSQLIFRQEKNDTKACCVSSNTIIPLEKRCTLINIFARHILVYFELWNCTQLYWSVFLWDVKLHCCILLCLWNTLYYIPKIHISYFLLFLTLSKRKNITLFNYLITLKALQYFLTSKFLVIIFIQPL